MQILEILNDKAGANDLSFLVIGGHAVNAYGAVRSTGDLDLLVTRSQCVEWEQLILGMKYSIFNRHENFIQFTAPQPGYWPLDLMIVSDEIFSTLYGERVEKKLGSTVIKIPKLEHLISLKLHAHKQQLSHRASKDKDDIIRLIEIGGVDPTSEAFRQLCLKYVTIEQYEKIVKEFRLRQ